jgi:hypothetical protein
VDIGNALVSQKAKKDLDCQGQGETAKSERPDWHRLRFRGSFIVIKIADEITGIFKNLIGYGALVRAILPNNKGCASNESISYTHQEFVKL